MRKSQDNKTRTKLQSTPFKTAGEMDQASEDIQMQVWKRLEHARIFKEMIENTNYQFIKEELREGLTCNYGDEVGGHLVKVYSEGTGIRISINKDLVKEVEKSEEFVEALIRSTADSFSKSYYQIKGMLPLENENPDVLKKAAKANKKRA